MPEQTPDPLERRLRLLAGSAAQAARGPAAAEIRARGTRRHHRRVSAVATVAAAAVVTIGTVAVGATDDDAGRPPQPAGPSGRTVAPTGPAPHSDGLTAANLPRGEELPANDILSWRTTDTSADDGQATISDCQRGSLAGLGAGTVWKRTYEQITDYPPGTTPDPDAVPGYTGLIIGDFAYGSAAQDAYQEIRSWIVACEDGSSRLLGRVSTGPGQGEAFLLFVPAGPDDAVIHGLAVGVSGDRVVFIDQVQRGQDYNHPDGMTPIEDTLTAALERLTVRSS